ncbi:MAG: UvrD-helicase domain-containing protein, partial [Eubacteriales bacterium]|nr:UvrD-helicase domain-containing protein [Eubacteriales bacterium]
MAEYTLSLERDTLSRNRIVSEMDENFFVEAGAGSGKTTMLVSRMAAMVESGIDISRICAITFTKAAAGEFYDRFQKLLIERSNPDYVVKHPELPGSLKQPDERTRERCMEALQNIDLCFMGTIDSFCNMVLSEHPSEAGIPSDANLVSDEDAAAIYKQQYVKISAGEYGEELQSCAKTFQAVHRRAEDIFVQGISFLMNNRNVHFNFTEAPAVDIDKVFEYERKELIRAVRCLADHPELKYEGNKGSRDAWERIPDSCNAVRRRWSTGYPNLLYAMKSLKDIRVIPEAMDHYAVSLGSVFVPGGKGRKPKWYEFASGEDGGLYEKLLKLQYDASMTFLMKCVPVMEQAMRDKGSLTFFDYLYYLRNMLKKDAEGDGKLIRYIYNRHSYFLIDEFQDTNPLQAEVFFYLSSEHPVPQWSACVPRKGSLFIVGDPKQSIYRFRSADVTSFLKVKKLFEANGGAILNLSRNFRSTGKLCAYFNRVFRELLPEETENQSRYEDIPLPEPTENEFQGIYSYRAYVGQAAAEHPDMTDPVRIADIIERLAGSSAFQLRGENDKEPRPVRYSDFMVITYGKKKLGPILAELDSRGIPTRVEGDIPFAENEALREIFYIFSAVADADDTLALYGALTGKLIALTREDLLQYRANGGTVSLKTAFKTEDGTDAAVLRNNSKTACEDGAGCFLENKVKNAAVPEYGEALRHSYPKNRHTGSQDAEEQVRNVAEKIDELRSLYTAAGRLSPAALFSRIMDDFRVYQALPSENLEVVYYALELLRNAGKSGQVVSLKDGAAYLKGLIAGASGEERCLSLDADKDCVHMANLHKVKGLEAPIVILTAASTRSFSAAYRMQHGDDGSEGWLFSLESERDENGRSITYFQTADFPDEKAAEGAALAAEGQRLIYVAATRARNVLILCNSIRISRGRETPDSKWGPIMEPGLPDLFDLIPDAPVQREKAEIAVDAAELYKAAQESAILNDRSAENASYKAENPSRLHVLSKLSESPDQPEQEYAPEEEGTSSSETETGSGVHRFPALLGTMTHKLMEMLVTTGNQLDVR